MLMVFKKSKSPYGWIKSYSFAPPYVWLLLKMIFSCVEHVKKFTVLVFTYICKNMPRQKLNPSVSCFISSELCNAVCLFVHNFKWNDMSDFPLSGHCITWPHALSLMVGRILRDRVITLRNSRSLIWLSHCTT